MHIQMNMVPVTFGYSLHERSTRNCVNNCHGLVIQLFAGLGSNKCMYMNERTSKFSYTGTICCILHLKKILIASMY